MPHERSRGSTGLAVASANPVRLLPGGRPGRVSTGLVVRTVDGGGAQQVNRDRTSGPEGASGLHRVVATVR